MKRNWLNDIIITEFYDINSTKSKLKLGGNILVKKRNKAAITLLSGIIISGAVSTPLQINAMTDNIITVDQSLTRAIKTGVTTATSLNVRSGAGTS